MNLGASRATNAVLSDMNCDLFSLQKKYIYLFSLLRSVLSSGNNGPYEIPSYSSYHLVHIT